MRTISLRQFRDKIAEYDEPVTVTRRDKAGNFQVLGEWTPADDLPAAAHLPSVVKPLVARRARQANRDAILNRVNRGTKP